MSQRTIAVVSRARVVRSALLAASLLLSACTTSVLVVDTAPAGAHVTDHRLGYLGMSPVRRTLSGDDLVKTRDDVDSPSTLRLTISSPGHEDRVETVSVAPGDTARVMVTLTPTATRE